MQAPTIPPIHVTVVAPEHPWYAQWDFWISGGTLLVAMLTGWYAYETRRLRKGSDKAMAELSKHAENAATGSRQSAAAAERSAIALTEQVQHTAAALNIAERSTKAAEQSAEATKSLAEIGQRPVGQRF